MFWQQFWEEDGCAGPVQTGDYSTLLHHAETSRTRAFANTPLGALYAAAGITDEVLVPMAPLTGTDRRLLLWREEGRSDFSEREKAMLALVRPHLAELHTRRDRDLRGEPNLTPRQWEVLRQVATGAGPRRSLARSDCPTPRCASTSRTSSSASACRAGPRPWLACTRPESRCLRKTRIRSARSRPRRRSRSRRAAPRRRPRHRR